MIIEYVCVWDFNYVPLVFFYMILPLFGKRTPEVKYDNFLFWDSHGSQERIRTFSDVVGR